MDGGSAPVRGLIGGCHPGPTLVVTATVTALALSLGRGPVNALLVFAAVLTGQLATGWANDANDSERDARAGRWEKPVVRGWVRDRTLWTAAAGAAVVCVPLSILAAGVIGGAAHIVAVIAAWGYNLWLKTTPWSFLPYLVAFGLIAPFLTFGLNPAHPPAAWAVVTLALLGLGAHLANGIPDIETDRAVDAVGIVGRIGGRASANLSVAALLAATALLFANLGLPAFTSLAIMAGLATGSILFASASGGRHLFPVVMLLALISTLLLSVNADVMVGGR